MSTIYIDPDVTETRTWQDSGRCVWCGSRDRQTGKCFCRYCDSCSQCWISPTLADYKDEDYGPVSHWETCPACVARGCGTLEETIAWLRIQGDRIATEVSAEYAAKFDAAADNVMVKLDAELDRRKHQTPVEVERRVA